jgi:hypothetical protein
LEDTVHKNNLPTIEELKEDILAIVIIAAEGSLAAFVRNLFRQLQMVKDTDDVFENVFT